MIGAIAAGNAVALKPSEMAPATAKFLEDNIGEYMDATAVKVIQGGPAVGEQLMEHRWDKVLFTGKSNRPLLLSSTDQQVDFAANFALGFCRE